MTWCDKKARMLWWKNGGKLLSMARDIGSFAIFFVVSTLPDLAGTSILPSSFRATLPFSRRPRPSFSRETHPVCSQGHRDHCARKKPRENVGGKRFSSALDPGPSLAIDDAKVSSPHFLSLSPSLCPSSPCARAIASGKYHTDPYATSVLCAVLPPPPLLGFPFPLAPFDRRLYRRFPFLSSLPWTHGDSSRRVSTRTRFFSRALRSFRAARRALPRRRRRRR